MSTQVGSGTSGMPILDMALSQYSLHQLPVDTVSTEVDDTTSRVIKFLRSSGGARLVHSLSKLPVIYHNTMIVHYDSTL
jgi:hypothetical protein